MLKRVLVTQRIRTAAEEHFSVISQSISLRRRVYNSNTRTHVRLLGPCFKTGRRGRQPTHDRDADRVKHGHMLYMPAQFTRRLQSQEHRARTQGTNFTHAFGLMSTVRRVKYRRSAAANNTDSNAEILRHSNTTAALPST